MIAESPPVPSPLPSGSTVANRYVVLEVLGQGRVGITYRAEDLRRGEVCIVRELAPWGTERDGVRLRWPASVPSEVRRRGLHLFARSYERAARLLGIASPLVRETDLENGTAYVAMERLPLRPAASCPAADVLGLLEEYLALLDALHAHGELHLDPSPRNLAVLPRGRAALVDPGLARLWFSEFLAPLRDPGWPTELREPTLPWGPWTDLFLLARALYPLSDRAPETSSRLRALFEACLEPAPHLRPQSVPEARRLLQGPERSSYLGVQELDRLKQQLARFRFGKHECPACSGVLEPVEKPRLSGCLECGQGRVRVRDLPRHACPVCRAGFLRARDLGRELVFCPDCRVARLERNVLGSRRRCRQCGASFRRRGASWIRASDGASHTADEWRQEAGRAALVYECDVCGAQLDPSGEEEWTLTWTSGEEALRRTRLIEDWARIAQGLPPHAGNAACERCGADYDRIGGFLALLERGSELGSDPWGYRHRRLPLEYAAWIAAGKTSGRAGYRCAECGTEFDGLGEVALRLVRTGHRRLRQSIGQVRSLEDWHREAKMLPSRGQEAELDERLHAALRAEFRAGRLAFAPERADVHWRGTARWRLPSAGAGPFLVTEEAVTLGRWPRRVRVPLGRLQEVSCEGAEVAFYDGRRVWVVEPVPVEVTVRLRSGPVRLTLGAEDLAHRLRSVIAPRPPTATGVAEG